MFLDETWATTNMARRYGRSPSGTRLVMPVPHGHWKTTTFVAGLRADGLVAPLVVDGAINGELFEAYVRPQLVPTLRPGDVVVMDNLACHKRAGVRQAIEAAGCRVLYLPPYSPEFNPIEQAFAKLKALLRKAGERTVEGLWRLLAAEDPQAAELVKLRYFAGLSIEEAAPALGLSRATAYRHWAYARAWVRCEVLGELSRPESEEKTGGI